MTNVLGITFLCAVVWIWNIVLIYNEIGKKCQQGMEEPFFKFLEQKLFKAHNLNLN